MNDTISRQAAIDAVKKNTFRLTFAEEQDREGHVAWSAEAVYRDVMEGALLELPSAQVDLIAKIQNGIKITDADDAYSCGMRNGMRWCLSLIDDKEPLYENCPSAQPERKKGKWKEEIDTGERMLACSACGGRVFLETYETAVGEHGYRFCLYCGADMRQGEQE